MRGRMRSPREVVGHDVRESGGKWIRVIAADGPCELAWRYGEKTFFSGPDVVGVQSRGRCIWHRWSNDRKAFVVTGSSKKCGPRALPHRCEDPRSLEPLLEE